MGPIEHELVVDLRRVRENSYHADMVRRPDRPPEGRTPCLRDVLQFAMEDAFFVVRGRLENLTDEEFFWEPVDGAWSVRRLTPDHPTSPCAAFFARTGIAQGSWFSDEAWNGESFETIHPSPFTTIGWRIVHLASCKHMYHEHAFGLRRDLWAELTSIHTAADALASLDEGQRLLVDALADRDDDDLHATVLTNWGEEWPSWRIFSAMTSHDLQHGSEIGCVRDLYAHRGRCGLV